METTQALGVAPHLGSSSSSEPLVNLQTKKERKGKKKFE
jgi:hypothetical protein